MSRSPSLHTMLTTSGPRRDALLHRAVMRESLALSKRTGLSRRACSRQVRNALTLDLIAAHSGN